MSAPDLLPSADTITAIFGVIATWLFAKARGDQQARLRDLLENAIKREIEVLLLDPATLDKARAALEWVATTTLDKLKIKRNALIDELVAIAIERGLAVLHERLGYIRLLEAKWGELAERASAVGKAFTPTGSVPVLGDGMIEFNEIKDEPAPGDAAAAARVRSAISKGPR